LTVCGAPNGKLHERIVDLCLFLCCSQQLIPDIIYDFELKVDTSTILNAGNGVFLTFLVARELKPSRKQQGKILFNERPHKELRLARPMTAFHQDGFNMSVTVTGKHLHCPYNCPYHLPTI
jgi:hypothetical protein